MPSNLNDDAPHVQHRFDSCSSSGSELTFQGPIDEVITQHSVPAPRRPQASPRASMDPNAEEFVPLPAGNLVPLFDLNLPDLAAETSDLPQQDPPFHVDEEQGDIAPSSSTDDDEAPPSPVPPRRSTRRGVPPDRLWYGTLGKTKLKLLQEQMELQEQTLALLQACLVQN